MFVATKSSSPLLIFRSLVATAIISPAIILCSLKEADCPGFQSKASKGPGEYIHRGLLFLSVRVRTTFPKNRSDSYSNPFSFFWLQAPFLAAHFTRLLRLRVHSRSKLAQKQSRVRCLCRAQGTSLPGLLDFFLPLPGAPREWIPGGLAGEGAFISFCLCRRREVVSYQTTAPHLALLSAPSGPDFRRPEPACS